MSNTTALRFDVPSPGVSKTVETANGDQKVTLVRGTPEYAQHMAAAYDNARGVVTKPQEPPAPVETPKPPVEAVKMPDGGFEKFYDQKTGAYNWQAHAREVQWKLDQKDKATTTPPVVKADPKPDAPPAADAAPKEGEPKPEDKPAEGDKTPDEDKAAKDAAKAAGLNWDDLGAKINQTGTLEDADFEALDKVGIPKNIVEDYIKALTIAREANAKVAHEYAGGKDKLDAALAWASTNLDRGEILEINRTLASANWKVGIDAVMARFSKNSKGANEPTLLTGGNAPGTGSEGYKDQAEMIAAINKRNDKGQRLYDADPNYRARVRQNIALMK